MFISRKYALTGSLLRRYSLPNIKMFLKKNLIEELFAVNKGNIKHV